MRTPARQLLVAIIESDLRRNGTSHVRTKQLTTYMQSTVDSIWLYQVYLENLLLLPTILILLSDSDFNHTVAKHRSGGQDVGR